MRVRTRRWIGRNAKLLVVAAILIRVWDLTPLGPLGRLGGIGETLSVLSTIVLVVGALALIRWLVRRYLFAVSRRLGVAYFFLGVFPFVCLTLLVLIVAALGLASLVNFEAQHAFARILDDLGDEAARSRELIAEELPIGASSASGWIQLPGDAGSSLHRLVWVGGPDGPPVPGTEAAIEWAPVVFLGGPRDGRPPGWLLDTPFQGLCAVADSLVMIGSRPGRLNDGRAYLSLVMRPFDDSVAREVADATGARASIWLGGYDLVRRTGDEERELTVDIGRDRDVGVSVRRLSEDEQDPESDVAETVEDWSLFNSAMFVNIVDFRSGGAILDGGAVQQIPVLRLHVEGIEFLRDRFLGGENADVVRIAIILTAALLLGLMIIAVVIGVTLTASVTRAINALHRGTRRIAAGDLDHRIHVKSRDQLGALAQSFNEMTDSVTNLLEERTERQALENEMSIAADVQRTMLPKAFPSVPGLEGAAACIMAKHVGGDLYDFIPIGPGRVGILIGDVSGKGVSAALVMSNAVSAVRSFVTLDEPSSPARLLERLNAVLHRSTAPDCFVTMFYAEYDMHTGCLRYANAGHDWPIVFNSRGEVTAELEASGVMLGALPGVSLEDREIALAPGDVVVAYSDGLVDTVNPKDEPFAIERVKAALRPVIRQTPSRMVEALSGALRAFQGDAPEVDDVTMIVLKRLALPGTPEDGAREGHMQDSTPEPIGSRT